MQEKKRLKTKENKTRRENIQEKKRKDKTRADKQEEGRPEQTREVKNGEGRASFFFAVEQGVRSSRARVRVKVKS